MNTKIENYNHKQMNHFCTKWVWFSALTGDLVFLAIVNTLFFTMVKGLSASQITLATTIPAAIGIFIQPYLVKIIYKIGNTASVRVGALCLLVASILITFGNQFCFVVLGYVFYEIAFVLKNMEGIMLKNNLIYAKREAEYVSIRNLSTESYAVITAVIAFTSGFLFSLNQYLPMVLNILLCFLCFLLSLTMKDVTKYDKIPEQQIQNATGKMSIIVYIAILSYAFFYTAVNIGQSNSKLFIQYQLGSYFDATKTATYFSMIILMSRIARIVSNFFFDAMYRKLKDKINIVLCSCLILAFTLIVVGSLIQYHVLAQMTLMVGGFLIILAVRDPFKIYIQDLVLRVTRPEEQQAIFAHLELAKKIGQTLMGFVVSAALLKFSIIWVVIGARSHCSDDTKDNSSII